MYKGIRDDSYGIMSYVILRLPPEDIHFPNDSSLGRKCDAGRRVSQTLHSTHRLSLTVFSISPKFNKNIYHCQRDFASNVQKIYFAAMGSFPKETSSKQTNKATKDKNIFISCCRVYSLLAPKKHSATILFSLFASGFLLFIPPIIPLSKRWSLDALLSPLLFLSLSPSFSPPTHPFPFLSLPPVCHPSFLCCISNP